MEWHVANFRCRSVAYEVECVRDLDHESMKSISLGSHNFDKAQRNDKQHMCKVFHEVLHMALVGI
jgi:hypothetical protein